MDPISQLRAIVGADGIAVADDINSRHMADWAVTAGVDCRPRAVLYPRTTDQVAAVLRVCTAHRIPVVPQGGLTGLAGGATPVTDGVVLALERMRAIIEIDAAGATLTAEAGVPLQRIQEAAEAADMFFPLDIGGRGSCQIGGNVSTNAGGNRVLRFGMARDLVLGLEVVLADGTVIRSLNKMLKNNSGYDLKQLFIGSEGTLGVITQVVLRLFPRPQSICTALCAAAGYDQVVALLHQARARLASGLAAFEVMWPSFYRRAIGLDGLRAPLSDGHGLYVLVELLGTDQQSDDARFAGFIEAAAEAGLVTDAVIAQTLAQRGDFWAIRDSSGEFRRTFWPHVGFDVSFPTGRIGAFTDDLTGRLTARWPDVETVFFGHIADGNIHIGVRTPTGPLPQREIEDIVYRAVGDWQGAISAEHGIGLLKKPYLQFSRSPAEIALMRSLKATLDPLGILNPGKII
jgi:FAD/FMN-containing dehydrogenase